MIIYICNAFSLGMLSREEQNGTPAGYVPAAADAIGRRARVPRPVEHPRVFLDLWGDSVEVRSAVGHADTARLFAGILGRDVPVDRVTVALSGNDLALVGQYKGPRLPEGATELPAGATIEWWVV